MSKSHDKGKKVIIVAGPTASGKSDLALVLAQALDGCIVNADAMQLYRDLPILTAQPDQQSRDQVAHYLYGILPITERMSVARWAEMATQIILSEKKPVIVTGGTGLYLRALIHGLSPIPDVPDAVFAEGVDLMRRITSAGLHRLLAENDRKTALRLHPNDSQRILRAWCVFRATGRSLASWQELPPQTATFASFPIILLPDRAALYRACDLRFDAMVQAGVLMEVEALKKNHPALDPTLPGAKILGLRELAAAVAGEMALDSAVAKAKQATRNYAKRQSTWFRHQMPEGNVIENFGYKMKYSDELSRNIISKVSEFLLT